MGFPIAVLAVGALGWPEFGVEKRGRHGAREDQCRAACQSSEPLGRGRNRYEQLAGVQSVESRLHGERAIKLAPTIHIRCFKLFGELRVVLIVFVFGAPLHRQGDNGPTVGLFQKRRIGAAG